MTECLCRKFHSRYSILFISFLNKMFGGLTLLYIICATKLDINVYNRHTQLEGFNYITVSIQL